MSETADLYMHYQDWKSWDDLFVYLPDHAGYFAAELAGVKISGADALEIDFVEDS